jgi:protein involved in polysaccharide export with SLBB domain
MLGAKVLGLLLFGSLLVEAGEPIRQEFLTNKEESLQVGTRLPLIFLLNSNASPDKIYVKAVVGTNGTVALISNQVFTATGKSVASLVREIHDRYVPAIFPEAIVALACCHAYYVTGEVNSPGARDLENRLTVLQAVELAGGFTKQANRKKVLIIHRDGSRQVLNCIDAQKNPKLDLELREDDAISVPRKIF